MAQLLTAEEHATFLAENVWPRHGLGCVQCRQMMGTQKWYDRGEITKHFCDCGLWLLAWPTYRLDTGGVPYTTEVIVV